MGRKKGRKKRRRKICTRVSAQTGREGTVALNGEEESLVSNEERNVIELFENGWKESAVNDSLNE